MSSRQSSCFLTTPSLELSICLGTHDFVFGTPTEGLPSESFTVVLEAQFPTLPATLLSALHFWFHVF